MQSTLDIEQLQLTHGQVLYVIDGMNFVPWLSRSSLDSVLKKFRLKKIPDFARTGQAGRAGADFHYSFFDLLDCVLAMKLVSEGLVFRHVIGLMTFDPERLRAFYRRAYLEAKDGYGSPLLITAADGRHMSVSGLYLDFAAQISKSGALSTPGPTLLDPWQAVDRFMAAYQGLHPTNLIRLSQLATEAVRIALEAPPTRRGRRGNSKSST